MLKMLRSIHVSNSQIHQGQWFRYLGRRVEEKTIGIIGVGRIRSGVLNRLKAFSTSKIRS
jgi:D-3-phosphoglycerate dehydrogenase